MLLLLRPPRSSLGHLGHVLAAHKLSADARQFTLLPFGMCGEERFRHYQAKHRIAQELHPLIVPEPRFGGLRICSTFRHSLFVG